MQKRKQIEAIMLLLIVSPLLLLFSQIGTVNAENTAIEDEAGNIIITVFTNKDVHMMKMDTGQGIIDITPTREYVDEQIRGNNQVMDINGDLWVDQTDYDILEAHVNGSCKTFTSKVRCSHCGATDVNGDGVIDNNDLKLLKTHLDKKCELADCYFHGTRVYREDDPNNTRGYIWKIHYTPIIAGIRSLTFTPQSLTSTGTRSGKAEVITVHAEEYKNPEIIKTYVNPDQDKFLVHYKSNKPLSIYAVSPLETDKIKIRIENNRSTDDITEVELDQWDSIDYNKSEKTWKYDFITNVRGWRKIIVTGYGEQSNDAGGWKESKTINFNERIVDPLIITPMNINSYLSHTTYESYTIEVPYVDEEGNNQVRTEWRNRVKDRYYSNTARVTTNEDTDYVIFSGCGSASGHCNTYSRSGNKHVFTSNSWTTKNATASGGSVEPHAAIGEHPDHDYDYEVIYFPENGETTDPITAKYNALLTVPTTPHREGYFFKGWFKDDRGINEWNFTKDRVRQTTHLYAQWDKKNYTVTFDSQGGTSVDSKIIPYQTLFNPPGQPTKDGYIFNGWYKDRGGQQVWDFANERVGYDLTLYANWAPLTYKVSFDTKGGNAINPIGVICDQKLPSDLETPCLTGFTFVGWFKDSNTTIPWRLNADVVTEDTRLYAKWTISKHHVDFDTQGASTVGSQIVIHNALLTEPPEPTFDGYMFSGWFREPEAINKWHFNVHPVVKPITLYAKWLPNRATIVFESNGGEEIPKKIGYTGVKINDQLIPENTRTGYEFDGWFENAAFSGKAITRLPDVFPAGTTTYYAKWNASNVQILFETNEGSKIDPIIGKTGETLSNRILPSTTRDGYTLIGFYRNNQFTGGVVTQLPEKYSTEDETYYAQWDANRSEIRFQANDDDLYISPQIGTTDQTIDNRVMPVISKAGYTLSWYENVELAGPAVTQLPGKYPIGTTTYYAKWMSDDVELTFNPDASGQETNQLIKKVGVLLGIFKR